MRPKWDPEYLVGALILMALGILILAGAVWLLAAEVAYWRHPHTDGRLAMHVKVLFALVLIPVGVVSWICALMRRKGR